MTENLPSKMMRKKATYTNITPIPSFIPRQLAIDILHSHGEIIELNPLVLGYEPIKAPRDAPADEFYSTWYEIEERIQYIPGMGKLGSGKIKFKGCFHNMPWGLQTHIYAPAGVDLRNKWRICGNQPGELPEQHELGLGAPPEGLYLREDVELKCNMTMVSFVKKETKAASKILVDRLIKKAELLDSGALQAMMENGRLKTHNPADRSSVAPPQSPLPSPRQVYNMPQSPMQSPLQSPAFPPQQLGGYTPPKHSQGANNVVMELPGDFQYAQPLSSPHLAPPDRSSFISNSSGSSPNPCDGRWSTMSSEYQGSQGSQGSRPTSYNSDSMRSPGFDQKQTFATELPTMQETHEEDDRRPESRDAHGFPKDRKYVYNPQDYANTQNTQNYSNPPHDYGSSHNHPQNYGNLPQYPR